MWGGTLNAMCGGTLNAMWGGTLNAMWGGTLNDISKYFTGFFKKTSNKATVVKDNRLKQ